MGGYLPGQVMYKSYYDKGNDFHTVRFMAFSDVIDRQEYDPSVGINRGGFWVDARKLFPEDTDPDGLVFVADEDVLDFS